MNFATLLALSFALTTLSANADNKPDMMAVMGDSIPSASLAGTYLLGAPKDRIRDPWGGDGSLYENRYAFSWFSGVSVDSHYQKLKRIYDQQGQKLQAYNIAEPGAESTKLVGMAQAIERQMWTKQFRNVVYVAIMVGSNDACNPSSPTGYPDSLTAGNISKAIHVLSRIKQKERIHVLVSSLPMIPRIREVTLGLVSRMGSKCEDWYKSDLFYCKTPLVNWTTPQEEAIQIAAIERRNRAIEDAVTQAQKDYPRMDIVYSDAFARAEIRAETLAGDCFHPNTLAQQGLSDGLWAAQPWYK